MRPRRSAWIEVDGTAYALPEDQVAGLRAAEGDGDSPLARLRLSEWVVHGEVADGEAVDGPRRSE